jgi:hypothetical protein
MHTSTMSVAVTVVVTREVHTYMHGLRGPEADPLYTLVFVVVEVRSHAI